MVEARFDGHNVSQIMASDSFDLVGLCGCEVVERHFVMVQVFTTDERVCQGRDHAEGLSFGVYQVERSFHVPQDGCVGSNTRLVDWATGSCCCEGGGPAFCEEIETSAL